MTSCFVDSFSRTIEYSKPTQSAYVDDDDAFRKSHFVDETSDQFSLKPPRRSHFLTRLSFIPKESFTSDDGYNGSTTAWTCSSCDYRNIDDFNRTCALCGTQRTTSPLNSEQNGTATPDWKAQAPRRHEPSQQPPISSILSSDHHSHQHLAPSRPSDCGEPRDNESSRPVLLKPHSRSALSSFLRKNAKSQKKKTGSPSIQSSDSTIPMSNLSAIPEERQRSRPQHGCMDAPSCPRQLQDHSDTLCAKSPGSNATAVVNQLNSLVSDDQEVVSNVRAPRPPMDIDDDNLHRDLQRRFQESVMYSKKLVPARTENQSTGVDTQRKRDRDLQRVQENETLNHRTRLVPMSDEEICTLSCVNSPGSAKANSPEQFDLDYAIYSVSIEDLNVTEEESNRSTPLDGAIHNLPRKNYVVPSHQNRSIFGYVVFAGLLIIFIILFVLSVRFL